MRRASEWLAIACCAVVGVYVGAMATEAGVLVPYWQSLPPSEFLAWYAANAQRLVDYFGPVTAAAVLVPAAAALVAVPARHPGRVPLVAVAVLLAGLLGLYFVYFEQANARFATGAVAVDAVAGELARWAWWHRARTAVSAVALLLACLAVRRGREG